MLKATTRMTNEVGYVFLILDAEDNVKACFTRLETAVASVEMSFADDAQVRLDDRHAELHSYSVILLDRGEEEYRGCISKQAVSSIAVGIIGL